jgi:hypothetical protein
VITGHKFTHGQAFAQKIEHEILTNQQESGVHDGGAVEHGGHENVVAGAVHKRHVAAPL